MSRIHLRAAAAGLAVSLAFLCLGALPGFVLCVSRGDHVAIEIRSAATCHPADALESDGCPPDCSDTLLGVGPSIRSPDPLDDEIVILSSSVFTLPSIVPPRPSRFHPTAPPRLPASPALRTTVLLL